MLVFACGVAQVVCAEYTEPYSGEAERRQLAVSYAQLVSLVLDPVHAGGGPGGAGAGNGSKGRCARCGAGGKGWQRPSCCGVGLAWRR